jgi:putative FmdB family regulatory protein
MPLYEYDCPGCGQSFEKRVSMSAADAPGACPTCGGTHARRKLSKIAIRGSASGGSSASTPVVSGSL